MDKQHLVPGDPILIDNIVSYLKAKGIFDEFRHECLADVDTKSSCQNLSQRVDGYTTKFLSTETWNPDLNKNELRNKLRRHIDESGMLAVGADHVVEQVINPKIHQLFLPRIIEVVHQYLNQENEKLNKKQQAIDALAKSEKAASDNSDIISNKLKPVLDPIADILSFTYSKPKQTVQTPTPSAQSKSADPLKTEKKKEESLSQTKLTENVVKVEKKKEDVIVGKVQDITQKIKKEEILLPPKPQTSVANVEKDEEVSDLKIQLSDSNDDSSQSAISLPKAVEVKIKKEIKIEDSEITLEGQKKLQKEDTKADKKKIDESKLLKSEGAPQPEETTAHKVVTPSKSNSGLSKSKLEVDKKKIKSHSQHKISNLNESHKLKTKELSGTTSSKSSSDKHAKLSSSKHLKTSSKDSSPLKITASSKAVKGEKDDSGNKSKSTDAHTKSPDFGKKNVPSKSSYSKKESLPIKVKHSSDKHEKHKCVKTPVQSQSDLEKAKKTSIQYSSSYDSSQGSDQDRSSASSISSKEKQKHFSKHHKKESGDTSSDKNQKGSAEKKRPRLDSDSGTDRKHKNGKYSSKHLLDKQRKPSVAQESAKIDSRSNSLGSTSSTSDSQISSSKDNLLSTSEDTSDNTSKLSEKKKRQANKDPDRCRDVKNLPPPPPPPPSSSLGVGTFSSAEVSSMDETQSSQESEFENESSDEDSSSESELENDALDLKRDLKTPEILNDIYDIILYSSSSSEFEGYDSTPEKSMDLAMSRISDVSAIHTSDLSSFDDEISVTEHSDSETEERKVKRKLTLKEAEDLLRLKAEKRRSTLKNVSSEVTVDEGKSLNRSLQAEEEVSQRPEPKRESRRERKLNPKYASSEYASIFNSKKTSFITKQANQVETPSPAPSPEMNSDTRKSDADSRKVKDKQLSSRKNLFPSPDPNQCPKTSKLPCSEFFEPPASPECSFILGDPNCEELPSVSGAKMNSDKNHNAGAENDTPNRIALKIKMSSSKSDNQTNTDKNACSVKRKFDGEAPQAKRPCHLNSNSTESVANENEPFNNKTNNSSLVHSVEQKEFFQKQKANNNGDVLNKIEHARKNSYSKPNHVAENNTSD